MKKILSILSLFFLLFVNSYSYNIELYGPLNSTEIRAINLGDSTCSDYDESDIPTIFIPGILASWYSEEGYDENKIKRWLPDPVTHAYDPLFYTFKRNGYTLKDVFYKDEFNLEIKGNPKGGLYLFGYDWKKDNKITATLLTQLYGLILKEYEKYNSCNIGKVNIISHSMGGLVARSMLEDMCVEYGNNKDDLKTILGYDILNARNGKLQNIQPISCKNPFSSESISDEIKVNKFITIATPHRGSPKALPIWEKGNIVMTEGFFQGNGIKGQLTSFFGSNQGFYEIIHGFNEKIPNGIVSLGQLLPDIYKPNEYNKLLEYVKINNFPLKRNSYPRNSFLENLNTSINIDKIFDKVEDKYLSYYSLNTGMTEVNNIIGYHIGDIVTSAKPPVVVVKDITETKLGNDIYDNYGDKLYREYFNILYVIRESNGIGGDGTVPSYNLLLVPNDSTDGKEVSNPKFESIEIKCEGNDTYKGLGEVEYEICNHVNMPSAAAYRVYRDIVGDDSPYVQDNHRLSLLYNLGYTNYPQNNLYLYNNVFTDSNFIPAELENDWGREYYSLSFGSSLKGIRKYEILSPINAIITDSFGRRIGINPENGMIINEIPGAFTSGDTEGSGEPEFFLIPDIEGDIHKISTYGTGNGEYHIVLSEITETGAVNKGGIIEGEANKYFGENYLINSLDSFNNITSDNTYLEIANNGIKTIDNNYNVKYYIRGRYKSNLNILFKLFSDNNTQISSGSVNIGEDLDISLPIIGKYKLELNLADELGNILSEEIISIEKTKSIIDDDLESQKLKSDKYDYFKQKYSEKLEKIEQKIEKFSPDTKMNLRFYILRNREELVLKINDSGKRELYEFFLDVIIEYLSAEF